MNICVIGTGFVGVVSGAVFASHGNQVIGLDIDEAKVASLKQGKVPFFEPSLEELLLDQQKNGTLEFTTDYAHAVSSSDVILIAVGTPSGADGNVDLSAVFAVGKSIASHLKQDTVIALKSTSPPGSLTQLHAIISENTSTTFHLASLPEFLREGCAVQDTLSPDRVVMGTESNHARQVLSELHQPFEAPIFVVKPESAQMGKYASNAYLATRITFANQIADLCEKNGADVTEVLEIIGADNRIGSHYWYPGLGYGGSCFPKDVKELAHYSRLVGLPENIFNKIDQLNTERIPQLFRSFTEFVGSWKNKKVAILGLSFKPQTNDMRDAPSVSLIPLLLEQEAQVIGYDPKATSAAPDFIKDHPDLIFNDNLEATLNDADVVIPLIEWPEIINFDFSKTKTLDQEQWFIDARNQFDPEVIAAAGYKYRGIGRVTV